MTQKPVSPTRHSAVVHPHRWRILALLGIAQLMLIVDVTVVAIALPHIAGDLGLGREALTWAVGLPPASGSSTPHWWQPRGEPALIHSPHARPRSSRSPRAAVQ